MSLVIDAVFVTIFLFFLIRHARLGLACSVLSAGRLLLSLLLASMLHRPVSLLLSALADTTAGLLSIISFVLVFFATLLLSGLLVRMISKIRIPIVTKVDKLLGAILGVFLGLLVTNALASVIYTGLELVNGLSPEKDLMKVYENSYAFKFAYGLKIFQFIRNLI